MPHIAKTAAYHLLRLAMVPLSKLTRNEMESIIAQAFAQKSAREKEFILSAGQAIAKLGGGIKNDIDTNGERWLIEQTGRFGFKTIFDVGANVGHWSELAYQNHAAAQIHAFEIVPDTFAQLECHVAGMTDRISCHNFGFMDQPGEITIFTSENSELSSIHQHGDLSTSGAVGVAVACRVRAGADFVREAGITMIDFMKIDTEGAESKVLAGFESLFAGQQVRLVLFEYNRGALMGRFLLADFYDFFTSKGYRVGKLTPEGVIFRDYDFSHEDFYGPNYVACLASEAALVEAISA